VKVCSVIEFVVNNELKSLPVIWIISTNVSEDISDSIHQIITSLYYATRRDIPEDFNL
jgi:hypothetical protein